MLLVTPDCFSSFACLKGECRHTCCRGWEIDVDEESLCRYHALPESDRAWLKRGLIEDENGARFRLDEKERCAFLRPDGLCKMIVRLGEGSLCQVCRDHPRFRNFFSDRVETGLGLCCEAAGRLILNRQEKMAFLTRTDGEPAGPLNDDEKALLSLRAEWIAIAQDRRFSMNGRMEKLLEDAPGPLPDRKETADFLLTLERLDADWTRLLMALRDAPALPALDEQWEIPLEQFLVYLLWRHLPAALEDGMLEERLRFAVWSCRLLGRLTAMQPNADRETFMELCRLYSSEIEYSDENENLILDWLA